MCKLKGRCANKVVSYISVVLGSTLRSNLKIDGFTSLLYIERGRETIGRTRLTSNIHNTYDYVTVFIAEQVLSKRDFVTISKRFHLPEVTPFIAYFHHRECEDRLN